MSKNHHVNEAKKADGTIDLAKAHEHFTEALPGLLDGSNAVHALEQFPLNGKVARLVVTDH